nr:MAG TPA: Sine oculis-binding protein [Caudoviricetes sp.]
MSHTDIFQLHTLTSICRSGSEFLHIQFFRIFVCDWCFHSLVIKL